ncbi:4-hydroxy-tetrahydrodipicolinate reductase [Algisphaera agarilytica]|uniref:4-hydroxy-tetrahydrodipicolinate reductase n=1 Tax=Algisphaera agarilytica TaxID=1385975 RepID=A0A7X0H458_9BACT|nr:4-hydroxy-tetrahydrodipicolinate reductase [Algisphaera agarilytica]MBB6428936.1 4-hydroxy-tetrahydrodipicolinate reductase [Algisphaera agarilytica]
MTTLAIHGSAGRMGQRLIALADADADLTVTTAIDAANPDGPQLAALDAGQCDVLIDFTLPDGFRAALARCVETQTPIVVGTTGLTDADQADLDAAAQIIPVLQATNFSQVVNVLNHLSAQAVKLLGDDYDLEILEAHHRYKQDAPSGTALTLARVVADAAGRDFDEHVKLTRHGDDPRQPKDITVQTLRIGDDAGQHTLFLAAPGERLELKHVSTSRDSYASGALRAAKWLAGQQPGRYDMKDVMGLK